MEKIEFRVYFDSAIDNLSFWRYTVSKRDATGATVADQPLYKLFLEDLTVSLLLGGGYFFTMLITTLIVPKITTANRLRSAMTAKSVNAVTSFRRSSRFPLAYGL